MEQQFRRNERSNMLKARKQLKHSKLFELVQQSSWERVEEFILDTNEGKEEAQSLGIELLYIAIEYRAPADLIMAIFDILEKQHGKRVKLNHKLLLKALYLPTRIDKNVSGSLCSRKWESSERVNVARFLSRKIP